MHLRCWSARKMSQFTHFCGVKFLASKSGTWEFWTNFMSAHTVAPALRLRACGRKSSFAEQRLRLQIYSLAQFSRHGYKFDSIAFLYLSCSQCPPGHPAGRPWPCRWSCRASTTRPPSPSFCYSLPPPSSPPTQGSLSFSPYQYCYSTCVLILSCGEGENKIWADFHTFACLFYSAKWEYEPYWSTQWQGIIGSLKKSPHFERRIREVVNHFIKTARTYWMDISLEMLDGGFPLSAE